MCTVRFKVYFSLQFTQTIDLLWVSYLDQRRICGFSVWNILFGLFFSRVCNYLVWYIIFSCSVFSSYLALITCYWTVYQHPTWVLLTFISLSPCGTVSIDSLNIFSRRFSNLYLSIYLYVPIKHNGECKWGQGIWICRECHKLTYVFWSSHLGLTQGLMVVVTGSGLVTAFPTWG